MKSVPQALADLGALYEQRNKLYGDNYKMFGKVMVGMFPGGILLQTEQDFNRFALLNHVLNKITRYSRQFGEGGHPDSLDDISVYAQMLQEYDGEIK